MGDVPVHMLFTQSQGYDFLKNQLPLAYSLVEVQLDAQHTITDFKLLDTNDTFLALFGLSEFQPEMSARKTIPFLAPTIKGILEILQDAFSSKSNVQKDLYVKEIQAWLRFLVYHHEEQVLAIFIDNIQEEQKIRAQLKTTQATIRSFLKSVKTGVLSLDAYGTIRDVNPAACEIFGGNEETFIGKHFAQIEVLRFNDVPKLLTGFTRVLEGEAQTLRLKIKNLEGTELFVQLDIHRLEEADEHHEILITIENLTHEKKIEEALRESEEIFRLIVENAHEGIIIVDEAFRALYVNKELGRIIGSDTESLLGKDVRSFIPHDHRHVFDPSFIDSDLPFEEFEVDILRKDGSSRRAEVKFSMIRDPEGRAKTITELYDISERRDAEQRIRRQLSIEEAITRVTRLFAQKDDPSFNHVLAVLGDGLDIQRLCIARISMEAAQIQIINEWRRDCEEQFITVPIDVEFDPHASLMMRLENGEELIVQGNSIFPELPKMMDPTSEEKRISLLVPIQGHSGILMGCIGLTDSHKRGNVYREDVSALRVVAEITGRYWDRIESQAKLQAAEEQLQRSQKLEAVGLLAGGVAHDFNNLLMVISGQVDLILMQMNEDDELYDKMQIIREASARGSNLTRQLLAFSSKQSLELKTLNLNNEILNMKKMFQRIIGEHIDLKTKLDSRLHNVKADPGRIEQLIVNLVVNARDAMPSGGTLRIETENVDLDADYVSQNPDAQEGPHVVIRISDTGEGISHDLQSRIFDPFFTTKPPGQGTGLGLSTVYGIVKQSNGHLNLKSEVDKGTEFLIYLPSVDDLLVEIPSEEVPIESLHGTEDILVVEDEKEVRYITVQMLKMYGYQVEEAENGKEAYDKCEERSNPYDLIISDVIMPKMGGAELVERLRDLWPELRVLFISGYANSRMTDLHVDNVSTASLQKPFEPNVFLKTVRHLLDK